MALSADAIVPRLAEPNAIQEPVGMAATTTVYLGAILARKSGYVQPAAESDAGDYCVIAVEPKANSGSAGAVSVKTERYGIYRLKYELTNLAVTDEGAVVYAKDDETFTKTAGTNTPLGRIFKLDEMVPGSYAWVFVPGELKP